MKLQVTFGAAVAALLSVAPAFAQPMSSFGPQPAPVSGYLELYGTSTNDAYWSDYNPWPGFGGAARATWWMDSRYSLQLDLQGVGQWNSYPGYEMYYTYWNVQSFAHANMRGKDFLLGVFGGFNYGTDYDMFYGMVSGAAGIEGQWYMGNLTLNGQVGAHQVFRDYCDCKGSATFINGEARWFLTPNTKVSLNVGRTSGDVWNSGDTYTMTNWGIEGEQKLGATPFSIFARYDSLHYSYTGDPGYTATTFKGGIRMAIGERSLLDRDRNGSSLKVDLTPILWQRAVDY